MDSKFKKLAELGAADFAHINGNLIDHLKSTKDLLSSWPASPALQDAGLYHAAYGTAAFEEQMVAANQREKIARIIGPEAEEIVYQYCACDRDYFWPQLGLMEYPKFRNRFTLQTYPLERQAVKDFCELTLANELEIAMRSRDFITQHGSGLLKLFTNMAPFLSPSANSAVTRVLG